MNETPVRSIDVAVAILRDAGGRVLLCRRPDAARYGGKWEFPGGKLEPGETHEQALRRELREELDIDAPEARQLHRVETLYDDGGRFCVTFFVVEAWQGEPRNLTSSELAWVMPERLDDYEILDGSRDVCRMLVAEPADSTAPGDSSRT